MSSSDINRKIAVIFATDVVGYSKHMEKDEDATLASLNDCNKIIEPLIKKQKGRIFNIGGDSVFAEFPSAVAAVNTAVEFQKQIKDRNDKDKTEAKSRTPNFNLEKNLKMMSDTVDKDFYDNFLSAVKSACK